VALSDLILIAAVGCGLGALLQASEQVRPGQMARCGLSALSGLGNLAHADAGVAICPVHSSGQWSQRIYASTSSGTGAANATPQPSPCFQLRTGTSAFAARQAESVACIDFRALMKVSHFEKECSASQNLRDLRSSLHMEEEMGTLLG